MRRILEGLDHMRTKILLKSPTTLRQSTEIQSKIFYSEWQAMHQCKRMTACSSLARLLRSLSPKVSWVSHAFGPLTMEAGDRFWGTCATLNSLPWTHCVCAIYRWPASAVSRLL